MSKIETVDFNRFNYLLSNVLGCRYECAHFFNEKDLFKLIELNIVKKDPVFRIKNWDLLESGSNEFSISDLFFNHFEETHLFDEKVAVITMESYSKNKVFLCSIDDLEDLVNNYHELIQDELDFFGPFDYFFTLLQSKVIFYVNNEGKGLKCHVVY